MICRIPVTTVSSES